MFFVEFYESDAVSVEFALIALEDFQMHGFFIDGQLDNIFIAGD